MAQQTIGIGASANDGTGDTIRDSFDKCNDNFTELYTGLTGLLDFKGSTDCSANPNYPSASKGDYYLVSVAGKIGGASGVVVSVGDSFFATADNAGGTQASVGTSWAVVEGNLGFAPVNKAGDTMTGDLIVPAETYGVGWNGSNEVPTKNDVYDKIETVAAGSGSTTLAGLTDVDTSGVADGDALTYDSGSSKWIPGAGGGGGGAGERTLVVPSASSFTLQNTGTSSISSVSNGMLFTAPSASAGMKFAKYTAGVGSFTSFTIILKAKPVSVLGSAGYVGGIALRNSSSGKILVYTNAYNSGLSALAQRWSDYSTFNANITAPFAYNGGVALNPWQKIVVGGGNVNYYLSPDGINWSAAIVTTEALATYITSIDEIAFITAPLAVNADVILQSWEAS